MTADFTGTDVSQIEGALEAKRPGGWKRLTAASLALYTAVLPRAGWELAVPRGQFRCRAVDRLQLLIDRDFPASEPRVAVPQLKLGDWPHVEAGGVLCLLKRTWDAPPADRVISAIIDAGAVLNMDEAECREEFFREFGAYWSQLLSVNPDGPLFLTLLRTNARSREIFYAYASKRRVVVLGDDHALLRRWLDHSGEPPGLAIRTTPLIWLLEPWVPATFPEHVRDVFAAAQPGQVQRYLQTDEALPIVFGTTTETGPIFAGVEIPPVPRKQFRKGGFRNPDLVPGTLLGQLLSGRRLKRCRTERADAAWVHGRDHNAQQQELAAKKVGLVGCGSLGAAVARLLAQSGVGHFVLVDGDKLSMANTSRHALGAQFVRENKATATRSLLVADYPNISAIEAFEARFQKLTDEQRARLASCDLVISAGIDWAGDFAIDHWRLSLAKGPDHLCTWVEEFAVAGHAVVLSDRNSLRSQFSADGVPVFRLTTWPVDVQTLIVEAGCGNLFQPHGAIDLNNAVTLAAQLALDVLTGDVTCSCRRVWLGDLERLRRLGGIPDAQFDGSNVRKEYPWPSAS